MTLWNRTPIARKLYLVIGTMAVLIACELATLRFAMHTLSAVRAFVAGEGDWSKAQKDSALGLQHFALTGDEDGYRAFLDQLRIPDGDHRARVELEKPDCNDTVVREGFLQGRIAADDIPPMIDLLRRFHSVSYLARAISRWQEADRLLREFRDAGVRYHDLLRAGTRDPRALSAALSRINQLNDQLTVVEVDFSNVLGQGSRWMERVVISLLFLAVLTVEAIGLTLTFRISRAISRGLGEANAAAERIGSGDFSTTIPIRSRDELGRLAEGINHMGALLARSYTDLETRVRQRTTELEAMAGENARLYEEAKAAVAMRDEFISIASHELKTPLAALTLQVDLLSRQVDRITTEAPERERIARSIESTLRQARRLTYLSNELMDLTAIRVGRLKIHREPCDLAAIVRDVAMLLGPEASRAGSLVELDADIPVPGHLDPVRMAQIASNLVTNAIKYGNGQSIHLSLRERNGTAILSVRDHGIGIAHESVSKVFDRFERAPEAGAKYPGLGLGLYITRQIVELHGGTITVESRPGEGSTFTVELPLRDPPKTLAAS